MIFLEACVIIICCHEIKYYNPTVNFYYCPVDVGNISPDITELHLMNTYQMMKLIQFVCLMVGDLIPDSCEIMTFYLTLLKIVDLIMAYTLT